MKKDWKLDFFRNLAAEIKPQGFRSFLLNAQDAWMYVITPNNSLILISENKGHNGGLDIVYKYEPTVEFGDGYRYNKVGLYDINAETLIRAEECGKANCECGWKIVPNTYNTGTHMEYVNLRPKLIEDAYKTMMKHWCARKLVEL